MNHISNQVSSVLALVQTHEAPDLMNSKNNNHYGQRIILVARSLINRLKLRAANPELINVDYKLLLSFRSDALTAKLFIIRKAIANPNIAALNVIDLLVILVVYIQIVLVSTDPFTKDLKWTVEQNLHLQNY